jgi:hypothetical protein
MDNCKENTWMGTLKGSNNPIEIAKFVMCSLCFFVHVVEYIIVVAKTTMLSSFNGCNQNSMILFTFHLHFQ